MNTWLEYTHRAVVKTNKFFLTYWICLIVESLAMFLWGRYLLDQTQGVSGNSIPLTAFLLILGVAALFYATSTGTLLGNDILPLSEYPGIQLSINKISLVVGQLLISCSIVFAAGIEMTPPPRWFLWCNLLFFLTLPLFTFKGNKNEMDTYVSAWAATSANSWGIALSVLSLTI